MDSSLGYACTRWHSLNEVDAVALSETRSCAAFAGLSTKAASQGSSPAPAAKPAAPDPVQLHGSMDLLGEVQRPSPVPSATPEPAASSEALRAQSDDSLVALGRGDQEKSLSLSGWNRDTSSVPGTDLPGSLACPEAHPAQVPHPTHITLLSCPSKLEHAYIIPALCCAGYLIWK